MALNPVNSPVIELMGRLDPADGVGRTSGGDRSDKVCMTIRVRDESISDIRFECDGCQATVACAATAARLARGRHLDEAAEIAPDTVADALGTLPSQYRHCAELACEALSAAIMDYVFRCVERERPE
ncbi:MAG: NifU-like protein [Planctomycetes bacterium ADurb.Bin126]|nr:MAG: NifU-like protein [Planctomycetes bacterium ADurb.Bin126]HOD80969.1 iron-sulfur cluster assembly scaffold protein [Phycisphaerae bacterium]HQL73350.1 iron-sulfur cluster assembly scaffold protein [Phycisphaerae bacterium]